MRLPTLTLDLAQTDPEAAESAALVVCGRALDTDDARLLLTALGLREDEL